MAIDPNAELGSSATYPKGGPGAAYTGSTDSAQLTGRSLVRTIYENPVPVIAAGIGLALLLTSGRRASSFVRAARTVDRYNPTSLDLASAADRLQRTARRVSKMAREEAQAARRQYENGRSTVSDFASTAAELAGTALGEARRRAAQLKDGGLTDLVTNNKPVALSALGIVLGALTAAALPYARSHGWLGGNEEDSEARW